MMDKSKLSYARLLLLVSPNTVQNLALRRIVCRYPPIIAAAPWCIWLRFA